MGLTFKENCPDTRNSKSVELVKLLYRNNSQIDCLDPYINDKSFLKIKNKIIKNPKKKFYDLIVISVAHDHFKKLELVK